MPAGAEPKAHHADRPKEKLRSGAVEPRRPKTHDRLREPHREPSHRTSHRSSASKDGSKIGISKDGLRDGPKEIPHEVVRDRDREVYTLSAGHSGLHTHQDGASHHSAGAAAHWASTKRLEEFRSKPLPTNALATVQRRLSSDPRPLAGQADAEAKLRSGPKGEVRSSTTVVCVMIILLLSVVIFLLI